MIKLITDRLIIRDYLKDDFTHYHEILSDEKVMYYLQDIKTKNIEESMASFNKVMDEQKMNDRTWFHFKIEDRITKEFIGCIGFTVTENTHFGKLVHLGYFLLEKFWNKGFTTEAVKKVIEYAFLEGNVYRIHTGCHKENVTSEKIMQKCGFIKEAEFVEYILHDGKLKDRVEYRLLKHEWRR